jgi:rubrerythrin
MFTIDEILDLGTRIEKNGEKLLREAQTRTSDPNLALLLKWLADEEVQHTQWLSDLKPISGADSAGAELEAAGRGLLRDILGDEGFSLDDLDFSKIEQRNELLMKMIEFENDTVLFYQMIQTAVSDKEVLDCIDTIIAQEKKHAQRLQKFIDSDMAE